MYNSQGNSWIERVKASKPITYSVNGAALQEYCLARLDYKNSEAHKAIGRLVTSVNNGVMPVDVARAIYNGLLSK